jgi:hypothetical protein
MSWIKSHSRPTLEQTLTEAIQHLEAARDSAETSLEVSNLITRAMSKVSTVSRATVSAQHGLEVRDGGQ